MIAQIKLGFVSIDTSKFEQHFAQHNFFLKNETISLGTQDMIQSLKIYFYN